MDLAEFLFRKAEGSAKAACLLAGNSEMDDQAVGYHAQQAVEKWINAVMASRGLPEESTHDLGRLVEVLVEAHIEAPPRADSLDYLSSFFVQQCCDELFDGEPLDREAVVTVVAEVGDWAGRFVES